MQDRLINEMVEAAKGYSDTRIMNTLTQAHNFSKEKVEAAKIIALERGLVSPDGVGNITDKLDLVKDAKRMLEDKVSIDEVLANFTLRGVDQKDAEEAVHQASKVADLNRKKPIEEAEEKKTQWWWYVFIAFIIIKWVLRAMTD